MPLSPASILGIWLRGLLAVALVAGGVYFLDRWHREAYAWEPETPAVAEPAVAVPAPREEIPGGRPDVRVERVRRVFVYRPGLNRETADLAAGLFLFGWTFFGGWVYRGYAALRLRPGTDDPREERGGEVRRLARPDGSELHVELYGPPEAPPIVLTHGWGANATEWYYVKKRLADRFRLIVWDLPGLGLSKRPANRDFSLEKFARDLEAVLALAGDRPAILLGHSIGGMIILTFCRLFPQALGPRVAGLMLVHTTYTNPVRTTKWAGLYTALEKPVLVPLLHLTIALWPLVWLMNWMSYLNGSLHRSSARESFAGTETFGQVEFSARLMAEAPPDVLARGMFGMMHYDATATLGSIPVATLVVAGDRDITTLPEASRFIHESVRGSELETLEPARHLGLIEHHEPFNGLVARFAAASLAPVAGRAAGL